ncbi:hypothetical protein SAMN06265361_103493 [Laceyella tengchongensis]|uniref:Uncharacterized protein n=1 Tax=Laceyella tengchongensis TaxID=574699 RepID=A0AA45WPI0_9BACL|nr:hypothetical protein SAMN06265361_103493 [Laceyella tengchongensis]
MRFNNEGIYHCNCLWIGLCHLVEPIIVFPEVKVV